MKDSLNSSNVASSFDGLIAKVQSLTCKASISSGSYRIEKANIEEVYVGRLAAEMLSFLWRRNLGEEMYRERLLAFYKFFSHDLSGIVPYFTILPEHNLQDTSYEANDFEEGEEYFSSSELYMKVPLILYKCDDRTESLKKLKARCIPKTDLMQYLEVKGVQAVFSSSIKEKVISIWNANTQTFKSLLTTNGSKNARGMAISINELQLCVRDEVRKSQVIFTAEDLWLLLGREYLEEKEQTEVSGWMFAPSVKGYVDANYVNGDEMIVWPLHQPNIEYLLELAFAAAESEVLLSVVSSGYWNYDSLVSSLRIEVVFIVDGRAIR